MEPKYVILQKQLFFSMVLPNCETQYEWVKQHNLLMGTAKVLPDLASTVQTLYI